MADKEQQSPYPPAPAAAHDGHVDHRKKNKRTKCILYVILFAVFQSLIILVLALTVLKLRTPTLRLRSAALTNLTAGSPANPSLSAAVTASIAVRNPNFGRYRFRNTTLEFLYRGTPAGHVALRDSRVGWRSTRSFDVAVELNVGPSGELASDLRAGVVAVRCRGVVRGRVEMVFVMRRRRSTAVDCSMEIVVGTQQIRNIVCR